MLKFNREIVTGMRDILPHDTALWNWFEAISRRIMERYGYREIRTPIAERASLFERSLGEETDVALKEIYSWIDQQQLNRALFKVRDVAYETNSKISKHESPPRERLLQLMDSGEFDDIAERIRICLRPEATASVVRAYIDHGMYLNPGLTKLYYVGPMFRRERPQKGRYRQFYQIGAEVLGQSDAPAIDAELIEMLVVLLGECKIEKWTLLLNSIGCKECRPKYVAALRRELAAVKETVCGDCQRRIETNPLRVLDCKVPQDQPIIAKLPSISEHLCAACRAHFAELEAQLKLREIPYTITPRLVRGLDYYMRTTFEITSPVLGAQNALVGGGRYDGLAELLGGQPTKGIGFALGTDRFIEAIREAGKVDAALRVDVFIAWLGGPASAQVYPTAVRIARKLRAAGLCVELPPEEMKLKKSLGLADKLGARYALILGENEIAAGKFVLKRLSDAQQRELSEGELAGFLRAGTGKANH